MKKGILFLSILLVSVGLMYSAEIILGFGWRVSDSGLVLGEYSFPFSTDRIIEEREWDGHLFRKSETKDYTLGKINPFQRRAYIVFGADWFLHKKQISLGLELSAGVLERHYEVRTRTVAEEVDEYIIYESIREYKETTIVIPANFFLITKYKFDVKDWFRPYIGIGGGLNSTIFLKGITEFDKNDVEMGEKDFIYSGAFVAMVGADFFFWKKAEVFIELRYMKPLGEGKNFREQVILGIGFRFI